MATKELDWKTYPIWFVGGDTENKPVTTQNLNLAFESLGLSGLQAKWVTSEDCLKIKRKEPKLFVMDSFSGSVFEHLVSIKCRVLGPLCILTCLRSGEPFPRRTHPVYSSAMRNIVVTCTKIRPSARSIIRHKVKLMCGIYSEDLTKDVTHLVCGEVGSKKYHVGASFGLPIVIPEWVDEVWNHCQAKQIHASALPYKYFRCPIFKGLGITVSQLSGEERNYIKEAVEREGGCYSSTLHIDVSTHLILLEPKGEKFKYAKEWLLFCLRDDWFYDSLEAGYCMDENLYLVEKNDALEKLEQSSMDCSENFEQSLLLDSSSCNELPPVLKSPFKKCFPSLDVLGVFDVSTPPMCDDFLDGCKIFLSDFNTSHMRKLCTIINSGGGMRFSKYSDCISHVVCGKENKKLLERIKGSSIKPQVVTFDWLLECFKEERLIDEAPFSCMEKIPLSPDNEKPMPCLQKYDDENSHLHQTEPRNPPSLFCMDDDIMKQYSQTSHHL